MNPRASKPLSRLALPLVISFTLRNLFALVDLGFATSLPNSASAVGAISFWIPFQMVYIALWVGLSSGVTTTLSQALGLCRTDLVESIERQVRRILVVLIAVLVGLGACLPLVVPMFGLEHDLTRDFTIYGSILAIGFPITGFWSILPDSTVKAHHDTRSTMIAGLLSTATNATLNATFVFVFGWGLAGIAIGTVLSRIPSLVYAIVRARRLDAAWRASLAEASPEAAMPAASDEVRLSMQQRIARQLSRPTRRILILGVPSTIAFVLTAIESSFVNGLLAVLPDSTEKIASWGVFNQILQLSLMPIVGSAVAVLPWLARRVAASEFTVVRRELMTTALLFGAISFGLTILPAFVFPDAIARRILTKNGEVDARSLALAVDALAILPVVAMASLPFILLRTSFEALNKPRLAILSSVLRFVVLSLPLIALGRHLGLTSDLGPIRGMAMGLGTAALLASTFVSVLVHTIVGDLEKQTMVTGGG
ncbi:MAG: hypothetical protein H6832_09915 [Planctomycetes bacterium]|nr:hypothetical protein [Planctomycetota bacterium]MCB9891850.1 hypothetical protein [Planctomycetota bacterium]MCB9918706.1 hypothetical protein [Planctomycetota bacterium]